MEAIVAYLGDFLRQSLDNQEPDPGLVASLQELLHDFCPGYEKVSKDATLGFIREARAVQERLLVREKMLREEARRKERQVTARDAMLRNEQDGGKDDIISGGNMSTEATEPVDALSYGPEVEFLAEFFPYLDKGQISSQLEHHDGDVEAAAEALTRYEIPAEIQEESEGHKESKRSQVMSQSDWEKLRESIVKRYDRTDYSKGGTGCPNQRAYHNDYTETKKVKLRYRDGQVVAFKGEKVIVEKKVEDPATFVSIRVKHKGRQKAMDGSAPVKTGPRTK